MKVRLTISAPQWAHKLQAKQAPNGTYWAQLITQGGSAFPHGKIIGGFESLDRIVSAAPMLYADLAAALPAEAAPLPTIVPSSN